MSCAARTSRCTPSRPAPTANPGFYGERYGRYLAEYARGGVGTVIAGQAQVHPTTAYQMHNNAAAWDPDCVPHLRRCQRADSGARRARLPAARAQRRRQPRDVVAAAGVVGVGDRQPHGGVQADRAATRSGRSSSTSRGARVTRPTPGSTASRCTPRTATSSTSSCRPRTTGAPTSTAARSTTGSGSRIEVLEAVRGAVGDRVAVGVRLVGDEEQRDGHGLGPDDCAAIAARWRGPVSSTSST